MTTAFEWTPEPTLLEKLMTVAKQRGRSPEALVNEAVNLYLDSQLVLEGYRESEPLTLKQRRDVLKLPLEERRRLLQQQAEIMATHYENNTEWQDLQPGDLIEY